MLHRHVIYLIYRLIYLIGMNGFPDVTILKFDLPSDAPNGQGINIVLDTAMNNPSPIGVQLGTIVLDILYQGTKLGQVKSTSATLASNSQSILSLTGVMIPLASQADLDKVRYALDAMLFLFTLLFPLFYSFFISHSV
jgi:hypothetical protein